MKIIKEGLYQLLEAVQTMPKGIFVTFVYDKPYKTFRLKGGDFLESYNHGPFKLIKELKNEQE